MFYLIERKDFKFFSFVSKEYFFNSFQLLYYLSKKIKKKYINH